MRLRLPLLCLLFALGSGLAGAEPRDDQHAQPRDVQHAQPRDGQAN